MRYFRVRKLIRDRIIEQMQENGQAPFGMRELNAKEYLEKLAQKLNEESAELLFEFDNPQKLAEEIADVQEVLDCIKAEIGLNNAQVVEIQAQKKAKNGGFEKKIYLEAVGMKEDNVWLDFYLNHPDKYPEIKSP